MKHDSAPITQTTRRLALAVAFTVALLQPLAAADLVPPPVPPNLQVPAGNRAFLEGHAIGTQNYVCLPSEASVAWTLVGPQATLFNRWGRPLITHFLSQSQEDRTYGRQAWLWCLLRSQERGQERKQQAPPTELETSAPTRSLLVTSAALWGLGVLWGQ